MKTAGQIGERGFIRLLRDRYPGLAMAGDDSAVLNPLESPVVTTDTFLEGSHFHRWWAPPETIGARLLEATLSDIAAMGAEPRAVFASIQIPSDIPLDWLLGMYEGLLHRDGLPVAGGETVRSELFGLTLTAVGEGGDPGTLMRRSSLQEGDRLWVTGRLGRALGAPELIEKAGGFRGADLEPVLDVLQPSELEQCRAFLRPGAAIEEGMHLRSKGVRSAIDVSDGLLSEASHLAWESGLDVIIEMDRVPLFPSVEGRPLKAASAGEDFELLFAAPPELETGLSGCTAVGWIRGPGGELGVVQNGKRIRPERTGYDHMEVQ